MAISPAPRRSGQATTTLDKRDVHIEHQLLLSALVTAFRRGYPPRGHLNYHQEDEPQLSPFSGAPAATRLFKKPTGGGLEIIQFSLQQCRSPTAEDHVCSVRGKQRRPGNQG